MSPEMPMQAKEGEKFSQIPRQRAENYSRKSGRWTAREAGEMKWRVTGAETEREADRSRASRVSVLKTLAFSPSSFTQDCHWLPYLRLLFSFFSPQGSISHQQSKVSKGKHEMMSGRDAWAGLPSPWATAERRTGSGPRAVRNWASQQDMSGCQVSEASSVFTAAPHHLHYHLNSTSCLISSGIRFSYGCKPTANCECKGSSRWHSPYENHP